MTVVIPTWAVWAALVLIGVPLIVKTIGVMLLLAAFVPRRRR
jgi:hypothetical protein